MPDTQRFRKNALYLLGATRGGLTRARMMAELLRSPLNPNQLATLLSVDYKTVTHHLSVLLKMNWVTRSGEKYGGLYSPTFTPEEREVFSELVSRIGQKL